MEIHTPTAKETIPGDYLIYPNPCTAEQSILNRSAFYVEPSGPTVKLQSTGRSRVRFNVGIIEKSFDVGAHLACDVFQVSWGDALVEWASAHRFSGRF